MELVRVDDEKAAPVHNNKLNAAPPVHNKLNAAPQVHNKLNRTLSSASDETTRARASAGTTGAPDARRPAAVVPAPRLCRPHAAHLGTQALRAQATGQGEPAVRATQPAAAVVVLLARLELPARLHGPVAPAAAQDGAQIRRLAPPQRRPVRHAAPPVGVAAANGPPRELREPQGPAGRPRPRAARCGALASCAPTPPRPKSARTPGSKPGSKMKII